MRRIAIAAAKGGTAKTTTAVTLAHGLALAGKRVVLVDCDVKRHAALHFGLPPEGGLAALLRGHPAHAVEVRQGLRLVDSGGAALARYDTHSEEERRHLEGMREAFAGLRDADYLLFDCPPWMGPVHLAVLRACDEIVLPVGADFLSLASAWHTLQLLRELPERGGVRPRLLGLLPTFYAPGKPSVEQVEAVLNDGFAGRVLQTRVRVCEALRAAPAQRGTVFETDPLARGALDHALLTEEIEDLAA